MARFEVTTMLAEGIRLIRVQNNIASKELAAHLDRSPAYISKLEKGEIKSIEDSELTSIFNFIIPNKESLHEKLETFIELIISRHSRVDFQSQLWFVNYAWSICKLPVPNAMVEKIRQLLEDENINITSLVAKINANVDLTEAERNDQTFPFNQWRENWVDNEQHGHRIKLKINIADVNEFLSGDSVESSYLLAYVVVRFMLWMIKFPEAEVLSDDERKEIDDATDEFLNTYEFFSILGKIARKRNHAIKSEINMLFSSDSEDIRSLTSALKIFLEALQPLGPQKTAQGLLSLSETLTWDAAFALKIMQLPFAKLENVSFTNKKQLLADMEMLIQRYQDMPLSQRGLESYD